MMKKVKDKNRKKCGVAYNAKVPEHVKESVEEMNLILAGKS
jgi:hypothetical protein